VQGVLLTLETNGNRCVAIERVKVKV